MSAWEYLEGHGVAHLLAGDSDLKHLFVRFGPRFLSLVTRPGSCVDVTEVFDIESARVAVSMAEALAKGPKAARERSAEYFAAFKTQTQSFLVKSGESSLVSLARRLRKG